jgi:protease-4
MERRRWIAIFLIVGMVFAAVTVNFLSDNRTSMEAASTLEEEIIHVGTEDRIVQIWLNGMIEDDRGVDGQFGFTYLLQQLDQVKYDPTIKGVVLRVNSPGGAVVATDEIHSEILEIKQLGKPVVVSMGSVAASGGYYIAAAADKIYANPATITGSLGVIFSFYNFSELAEEYGVNEIVVKSGQFKDIGNSFREMEDEEKAIFQSLVDESYDRFVDVISEGRNIDRDKVVELADGRIYSGAQAKKLGLIDEFGSIDVATQAAKDMINSPDATVIRYVPPFSMGSIFSNFFGLQSQTINLSQLKQVVENQRQRAPELNYLFRP